MISSIQDGLVALVVSGAVTTGGFLFNHGTSIAVLETQEEHAQVIRKELIDGIQAIQLNTVRAEAIADRRLALLEAQHE